MATEASVLAGHSPLQLVPDGARAAETPLEARFYPYDYNGGCVDSPHMPRRNANVTLSGGGFFSLWLLCLPPRPAAPPEKLARASPPLALTARCARPSPRSTVLAVAGKDFAIVAGDTRMSTGFNIKSRNVSKIYEINSKTVLGTGGFRGDITTLQKLLRAKVTQYEHQHGEMMLPHAMAQNLANTLYGRRFFPYYTWNVLAGLDQEGVGVVYSYDPVGNYERVRVSVTGSGESLIQPLLDNQLERQHQNAPRPPPLHIDLELDDAVDLVKDAFVSAGERDIRTGDSVEICVITAAGVRIETHPLNID